jgi:hypothetical protein
VGVLEAKLAAFGKDREPSLLQNLKKMATSRRKGRNVRPKTLH